MCPRPVRACEAQDTSQASEENQPNGHLPQNVWVTFVTPRCRAEFKE